jgi:hypothetical protein
MIYREIGTKVSFFKKKKKKKPLIIFNLFKVKLKEKGQMSFCYIFLKRGKKRKSKNNRKIIEIKKNIKILKKKINIKIPEVCKNRCIFI